MQISYARTFRYTLDITFPFFAYYEAGGQFYFTKLEENGETVEIISSYGANPTNLETRFTVIPVSKLKDVINTMMEQENSTVITEITFRRAFLAAQAFQNAARDNQKRVPINHIWILSQDQPKA